jgi:hypothetical protein
VIRGKLSLAAGVAVLIAVLTFGAFNASGMASEQPYHVLQRGKTGSSEWLTWVDRGSRKKVGSAHVCLGLALLIQGKDGLSQSESHECNAVLAAEPVVRSMESDSAGKTLGVIAILLSPNTRRLFVNIGGIKPRRTVSVKRISQEKAKRIGISPIAFWVHGLAGKTCLRRIISYDAAGVILSDSGGHSGCE